MMEVRGPNGIVIRFPDGTDPGIVDQVMRQAIQSRSGPSTFGAALQGVGQGFTGGWGDELMAGIKTGFGHLGDYSAELENQRSGLRAAQEAHPWAYAAGEIGGSLPTMMVPGVAAARAVPAIARLPGVVRSVVGGATQGAVYGAGTAEGGFSDRMTGAAVGAGVGMAAGAAAVPVGRAAGAAVKAVGRAIPGLASRAERGFATVAARDGLNADDFARRPPETMAMDAGENMQQLGQTLAGRPGPAQDTMRGAATRRVADEAALRASIDAEASRVFGDALQYSKPVDALPALNAIDSATVPRGGPMERWLNHFRKRLVGDDGLPLYDAEQLHVVQMDMRVTAEKLAKSANPEDRMAAEIVQNLRQGLIDEIDNAAGGAYRPAQEWYRSQMERLAAIGEENLASEAINKGISRSAKTEGKRIGTVREARNLAITGGASTLGGLVAGFSGTGWKGVAAGVGIPLAVNAGKRTVGAVRSWLDERAGEGMARLLTSSPREVDAIATALSRSRRGEKVSVETERLIRALMTTSATTQAPSLLSR